MKPSTDTVLYMTTLPMALPSAREPPILACRELLVLYEINRRAAARRRAHGRMFAQEPPPDLEALEERDVLLDDGLPLRFGMTPFRAQAASVAGSSVGSG